MNALHQAIVTLLKHPDLEFVKQGIVICETMAEHPEDLCFLFPGTDKRPMLHFAWLEEQLLSYKQSHYISVWLLGFLAGLDALQQENQGLKAVSFSGKNLEELPESIGNLCYVEMLDLSNNVLRSLPETIEMLRHLRELDIAENNLSALPRCLGKLERLRILNAGFNQLATFPECIYHLQNLEDIDLRFNQFSDIPAGLMQQLPRLVSIRYGNDYFNDYY